MLYPLALHPLLLHSDHSLSSPSFPFLSSFHPSDLDFLVSFQPSQLAQSPLSPSRCILRPASFVLPRLPLSTFPTSYCRAVLPSATLRLAAHPPRAPRGLPSLTVSTAERVISPLFLTTDRRALTRLSARAPPLLFVAATGTRDGKIPAVVRSRNNPAGAADSCFSLVHRGKEVRGDERRSWS